MITQLNTWAADTRQVTVQGECKRIMRQERVKREKGEMRERIGERKEFTVYEANKEKRRKRRVEEEDNETRKRERKGEKKRKGEKSRNEREFIIGKYGKKRVQGVEGDYEQKELRKKTRNEKANL